MRQTLAFFPVGAFAFLLASPHCTLAAGYEAGGCLTYTVFDALGKPRGKKVMLFSVKVLDGLWRIRTEPALEGKGGIMFHEASLSEADSVVLMTGFAGPKWASSPFNEWKEQALLMQRAAMLFSNPPVVVPAEIARLTQSPPVPNTHGGPTLSGHPTTNQSPIVAEAAVFAGPYPPADPSYVGFLRFAFVPLDRTGTNDLLPQVWDDGHPRWPRMRHARWLDSRSVPSLVSAAFFAWDDRQLPESIDSTIVSFADAQRQGWAEAEYSIQTTTNIGNLVIPQICTLTRFGKMVAGQQQTLTTDEANIFYAREIPSTEPMQVQFAAKTIVKDYRLSAKGGQPTPQVYILTSGSVPGAMEVAKSRLASSKKSPAEESSHYTHKRYLILAAIALLTMTLLTSLLRKARGVVIEQS